MKLGWMKSSSTSSRRAGAVKMLPGFMVAVLAEKGNGTDQSFWLAQVNEIHQKDEDGVRTLTAVWYESTKEFGHYRRCKGYYGKELILELAQCLFWFESLTARGAIPKQFQASIRAALEFGVADEPEVAATGNAMGSESNDDDGDDGDLQECDEDDAESDLFDHEFAENAMIEPERGGDSRRAKKSKSTGSKSKS